MADINFNSNTFSGVYNDDFDPNDNYHRILFNSGRPLQARELTQLQTIIQTEIGRFGSHVFKEGAAVNAGNVSSNRVEYIRLDTSYNDLPEKILDADTNEYISPLIGQILTSSVTGFQVTVNDVVDPIINNDGILEPATLYVSYITGPQNLINDDESTFETPLRIQPEELLERQNGSTFKVEAQGGNTSIKPTGVGTKISVDTGDFFVLKHFVENNQQHIYLAKYDSKPNGNVGFKIVQDIVTANDNPALFDNSGEVPNETSPGADRYRIRLILTDEGSVNPEDSYIPIAVIENGKIISQVNEGATEVYNKLADNLARRTFEESGDYIAERFALRFEPHPTDDSLINFIVSPGVAYINGYRAEVSNEEKITVTKPRDVGTIVNNSIPVEYGNYLLMDIAQSSVGLPDISTFETQNLYDGVDQTGNIIGTTRVRAIEKVIATNSDGIAVPSYKIYLFDFKINANSREMNIKSLGNGTTYINILQDINATNTFRKDTANTNLLFEIPNKFVTAFDNTDLTIQRTFYETTDNLGVVTISNSGETPTRAGTWIVSRVNGSIITEVSTSTNNNTVELTLTDNGLPIENTDVVVLAYMNINTPQAILKTESSVTTSVVTPDGSGMITLPHADIIEFISAVDSDGTDVFSNFTQDNGQRDEYYGLGKLHPKPGTTPPAGNVTVSYRYFVRGTVERPTGHFYTKASYTGMALEDIPSYTTSRGDSIPLRDVFDFRPTQNANGEFDTVGTGISLRIPQNTDTISSDTTHYLPKNAKVTIAENGKIDVITGASSFDPKMPLSSPTVMDLYLVEMSPYMITEKDLAVTAVESKRYTMRDIGELEERLARLEETTALSMLELSTSTYEVYDQAGNVRTKSGFIVDNFLDQTMSKTDSLEYRASIDPSRGIMRPKYTSHAFKLLHFPDYDVSQSGNTERREDFLHLKVLNDEKTYKKQDEITNWENINPFAVVTKRGLLKLSPSKDIWFEDNYLADKITYGDDKFNVSLPNLWDNWNWNWSGNEKIGTTLGSQDLSSQQTWGRTTQGSRISSERTGSRRRLDTFELVQSGRRTVDTAAAVVSGFSTQREVIDNRIISRTLIPQMRSQLVFFHGRGLRPNTRLFPFFGGDNFSQWTRVYTLSEYTTAKLNAEDIDYSVGYDDRTEHPDGSTNLSTDANGEIYGSFFVPSNEVQNYKTGTKEFRLIDISNYDNRDEAITWASSNYKAVGYNRVRQRTVLSTRIVNIDTVTSTRTENIRRRVGTTEVEVIEDPLAQTFTVDEETGVFLTGVKLRFRTKAQTAVKDGDPELPVYVQIRPTVNGYPSAYDAVPGTTVIKRPADINISDDGSAITYFKFEAPVYLMGEGTEYAITILSPSNDYEVYTGKAGEFLLGSTEKRLRRQPTTGSLFKSQNARTWEADQTQDLAYELTRAVFETSNTSNYVHVREGGRSGFKILTGDKIYTKQDTNEVYILYPNHGFNPKDSVMMLVSTPFSLNGLEHSDLHKTHTITRVDSYGFAFDVTTPITANGFGSTDTKISLSSQYKFDVANLKASVLDLEGTTINAEYRFTKIDLTGPEPQYIKESEWKSIPLNENLILDNPKIVLNEINNNFLIPPTGEAGLNGSDRSIDIRFKLETNSDFISPLIDLEGLSLATVKNVIDTVDSNPEFYQPETLPDFGTATAKHITEITTLAQPASGLKILLSAHKPSVCNFDVYYRTNSNKAVNNGAIVSQEWKLVEPEFNHPSDENPDFYRDYRFMPTESSAFFEDGYMEDFDQFQVKIVMKSSNTSKVPMFKDLRVIALYD